MTPVSRVLLEPLGQSQLLLPGDGFGYAMNVALSEESYGHSATLSRKANQSVKYRGPAATLYRWKCIHVPRNAVPSACEGRCII